MKLKKLNSRGNIIFDWIFITISIFMVIVVWTSINHAVDTKLMQVGKDLGGNQEGALDFLGVVWDLFPWMFCGGLILYGIVRAASRQEYDTGWRI